MWIALLFCFAAGAEPAPIAPVNDELETYLVEAAENHPALKAQHEAWRAALERIPQVTTLDDPVFSFGHFVLSTSLRTKMAISQKFPWFGTLKKQGAKAQAEADAVLARFYQERNRIFAAIKQAYYDYAYLAEQIRVTKAQQEIVDYVEEIVRSKYALGLVKQDDLLRIQIEQENVADRLERLLALRPSRAAQINEVLGRDILAEVPWPKDVGFPGEPPDAETVADRIRRQNPALDALDHTVATFEHEEALARREGYPDFTVSVDYTSVSIPRKIRPDRPFPSSLNAGRRLLRDAAGLDDFGPVQTGIDLYTVGVSDEPISYREGGEDNLLFSVSLNLPIHRKRVKAGVREALHRQAAAAHRKAAAAREFEAEARNVLFEWQDARRRHRLFEQSLIPKAEQTYQSLQSAYASGEPEAEFIDVLDSVQTLLEFELEQIAAARDWRNAAARLEFLVGGEVSDE